MLSSPSTSLLEVAIGAGSNDPAPPFSSDSFFVLSVRYFAPRTFRVVGKLGVTSRRLFSPVVAKHDPLLLRCLSSVPAGWLALTAS